MNRKDSVADPIRSALAWPIALLVPLALIGLAVRFLLTPLFLQFEYHLPGFPPDDYGFTTADRLHWGSYGVEYLINSSDISYLGDLRFDNRTPVFNERELSHMHDVKGLVQAVLRSWYAVVGLLVLLGLWAWRGSWLGLYATGLTRGGWLTMILALTVGLIATVGASGSGDLFWQFFSDFHGLFFSGDTWLFAYSDSLIRLYPLKFWEDAILYIGVVAALGGMFLAFGLRPISKRRRAT
jgi:integral membrane protein (TIGR01906 family)